MTVMLKTLLFALCIALWTSDGGAQTHKAASKASTPQLSPTEAAHDAVQKFMHSLKIADLPEGRESLESVQWITGTADRGSNFYSRPKYTSSESLYAKLFDTDRTGVQGYKEFFSLQGLNQAGSTKTFKYLVVAFKNQLNGEWKILGAFDDAEGDDSSFDFAANAKFFRGQLQGNGFGSLRDNYLTYAKWSFLAGNLEDAATALATAKSLSGNPDSVTSVQIDALSRVLAAVVQK
jgi:hypothetical protein